MEAHDEEKLSLVLVGYAAGGIACEATSIMPDLVPAVERSAIPCSSLGPSLAKDRE